MGSCMGRDVAGIWYRDRRWSAPRVISTTKNVDNFSLCDTKIEIVRIKANLTI